MRNNSTKQKGEKNSTSHRLACVAWRFWLGALIKAGGQRNREEIGAIATYFSRGVAARSRTLRARISRLRRSCARLDKTAMLRRLSSPVPPVPLTIVKKPQSAMRDNEALWKYSITSYDTLNLLTAVNWPWCWGGVKIAIICDLGIYSMSLTYKTASITGKKARNVWKLDEPRRFWNESSFLLP